MNWETCDIISQDDGITKTNDPEKMVAFKAIHDENERKKKLQLHKLQDPTKNEDRKAYIALSSRFGDLLVNQDSTEEIIESLMTADCETFLFNFADVTSVVYATKPGQFADLYKDHQVVKRQVKENFVVLEKETSFQICYCEIMNKTDNSIIPQFSFEVFSFRDDKIRKYRASYGSSLSFNEHQHPFIPSIKDQKLAKIKELNYAWADQPDLEKISSLLDETTEYKIWRWDDLKGFTFNKSDFVSGFMSLQENYSLKCVVPYEVYSEGEFIIGTYVYHLEGKKELAGQKKFFWLSSCLYAFDKDLNIIKINQQGELHPENEVKIPFEVYSRDDIQDKITSFYPSAEAVKEDGFDLTTDQLVFSFEISGFAPKNMAQVDFINGFGDYCKLRKTFQEANRDFKWAQPVDIYVDLHDPSHDVVILISCSRTSLIKENYKYSGVEMSFHSINRLSFENGKIAKMVGFVSEIPEMIPSPYDNSDFSAENIRRKEALT